MEPHATDPGYGNVIEGASYDDCDDRYAYGPMAGVSDRKWEKYVVEDHDKMRVLSHADCHGAPWMGQ